MLLSVLAGCSGSTDRSDTARHEEILPDGTVRIRYVALPNRSLTGDTLAVIDPWDERTRYPFSSLGSVLGEEDALYIADRRNREVVRLGIDGVVRQIIGRPGDGPGEFRRPGAMARTEDGSLWVLDSQLARISVFDTAGRIARTITNSGLPMYEFAVDRRSMIYGLVAPSPLPDAETHYYHLVRNAPDGQAPDTLFSMPTDSAVRFVLMTTGGMKIPVNAPPVFAAQLYMVLVDQVLVTVGGFGYRLDFRDADGTIHRMLEGPAIDLAVTSVVKARWVEAGFEKSPFGQLQLPAGQEIDRESLSQMPFSKERMAISGLKVDPLHRIWILAATSDPAIDRIDLFTWQGEYLGRFGAGPLPVTFLADGSAVFRFRDEAGLERFYVVQVR
jgi:hypothetical protein